MRPYEITPEQLDYRSGDDTLGAEASTLGLRPGQWPLSLVLVVDGKPQLEFVRGFSIEHHGEFGGYEYEVKDGDARVGGYKLFVFND